jgi:hypothetical protein
VSLLPRPRHLCQLLLVLAICGIPSSAAATETTRAVAAAACSKVKAATGQPPTRLTTALELDVRRDAPSPVATSIVTAHVPADWPEVAALRERLRIARRTKAPFFAEDTQPPEDTERAREQLRGKWPRGGQRRGAQAVAHPGG